MAEHNATDAAQALADERGVDLASVQATGADGRITKADVERHADDSEAAPQEAGHETGENTPQSDPETAAAAEGDEEVVRLIPNPKRTATEVIAFVDGERVAFGEGGALVTAPQADELKKLKGEDVSGNQVALLVQRTAS